MLFGLASFIKGRKHLKDLAEPATPELLTEKVFAFLSREHLIYLLAILSLSFFWLVIQHEPFVFAAQQILLVLSGGGLVVYAIFR